MTGYKRMRREHQSALIKVTFPYIIIIHVYLNSLTLSQLEEKCRVEMEGHKQVLDKEYENLLTSFRKELEKLHLKHQQELDRKVLFPLFSRPTFDDDVLFLCS